MKFPATVVVAARYDGFTRRSNLAETLRALCKLQSSVHRKATLGGLSLAVKKCRMGNVNRISAFPAGVFPTAPAPRLATPL